MSATIIILKEHIKAAAARLDEHGGEVPFRPTSPPEDLHVNCRCTLLSGDSSVTSPPELDQKLTHLVATEIANQALKDLTACLQVGNTAEQVTAGAMDAVETLKRSIRDAMQESHRVGYRAGYVGALPFDGEDGPKAS